MNLVRIGRSFSRSSASTFQKNVVSGNYGLRNEFTNALSPRFDAGLGLARGYLTSIAAASRNKIVSEIDSVFKNNLFPRLFSSGAPKKEYANYYPKNKKQVPKGNNQKAEYKAYDDDDSDDQDGGAFDIRATVNTAALTQMDAALDALARELTKLRTGRASVGVLDHIIVVTNGMKIPLNGMAAVSVLDPKTLSVSPYDPTTIKELEKAIVASPLGLNPKVEGQRLIAAIPPLTKEHMQAVCKLVTKSSEDAKQSIRRARQKALDTIKKSAPKKKGKEKTGSSISADDAKKLEKEVEDMTKKYIKSAEDMSKAKEKEITES